MAISYGTSWIEICNRALGRLGKGGIADLSSGGDLALYCNQFLGEAIETVLSAKNWYSCRTRVQLAPSIETPAYGYEYSYPLPADCVNPIEYSTEACVPEGNNILTDETELYLTYVPRPVSPASLPGFLKAAISTKLASLLATPLTVSDSLRAMLLQEWQLSMQEAYAADERRAPQEGVTAYTEAR